MQANGRVLIADDQPDVVEAARLALKGAGFATATADSPSEVLRKTSESEYDALLLDLNYARDTTSGAEGLQLLQALRASGVRTPVIVMTAWGTVDLAVEAMRRGAADFVQKPWDNSRLLDTVGRQIAQAKSAKSEMELAREVQQRLLPASDVSSESFEICGCCRPAGHVGGDFFDFFPLSPDLFGLVVADISGKGLGSALVMAHLHGALRSRVRMLAQDPVQVLTELNGLFWQSTPASQFATAFLSVYQQSTGFLRYVNCGHVPPMLRRGESGAIEELMPGATVLGLFPEWTGQADAVTLEPGDALAIFSDGLPDAWMDGTGEMQLKKIWSRGAIRPARSMLDGLLAALPPQDDDVTAVVLRRLSS